jgi:ankyrin repeat protein
MGLRGKTALMIAAENGYDSIVDALIGDGPGTEAGADVKLNDIVHDKYNWTALMYAAATVS